MMKRLIALAAALLTSAAAAQDGSEPANRTVEGAQDFLEKFYGAYPARGEVNGYQGGTQWAWREAPGFEFKMLEGRLASLKTVGRCRTEATIDQLIQKRHNVASPVVPFTGSPATLTLTIDWSKVQTVRLGEESMWRDGSRVPTGSHYIAVNGTGPSIYLVHVVQAEAQRAAFAMDYLMTECGPKFDQGF